MKRLPHGRNQITLLRESFHTAKSRMSVLSSLPRWTSVREIVNLSAAYCIDTAISQWSCGGESLFAKNSFVASSPSLICPQCLVRTLLDRRVLSLVGMVNPIHVVNIFINPPLIHQLPTHHYRRHHSHTAFNRFCGHVKRRYLRCIHLWNQLSITQIILDRYQRRFDHTLWNVRSQRSWVGSSSP